MTVVCLGHEGKGRADPIVTLIVPSNTPGELSWTSSREAAVNIHYTAAPICQSCSLFFFFFFFFFEVTSITGSIEFKVAIAIAIDLTCTAVLTPPAAAELLETEPLPRKIVDSS